jgi:arylsulfatase A-like enzyme
VEPRIDDGYAYFKWSHHPEHSAWPRGVCNEYVMWLKRQNADFSTPARPDCQWVNTGMPEELHHTKWCVDQAIEFMDMANGRDKPWLFSLNLFDPHHPFDPPEKYLRPYLERLDEIPLPDYVKGELDGKTIFEQKDHNGAYDTPGLYPFDAMSDNDHKMIRAAYYAMIDLMDRQIGRLLQHLEKTGELENTLIIFTSDHGEMLGDHGIYLKGPYFYDCAVRVPLIIAWPSVLPAGKTSDALVELIDLPETLLDACGVPLHPGMQGKSLWQLLNLATDAATHRQNVYCEYYNSNLNHRDPLAFMTMVSDGKHKLVKVHDRDAKVGCNGILYDLHKDPGEHRNGDRDPAGADVKTRLLEALCDRMAETCDPLPVRRASW